MRLRRETISPISPLRLAWRRHHCDVLNGIAIASLVLTAYTALFLVALTKCGAP
jgi:hypothetical protein